MVLNLGGLTQLRLPKRQNAADKDGESEKPVSLTFSLSHTYPEKVLFANESIHRVIGTKGKETIYSILAINLNENDVNIAKSVKAKVIREVLAASTAHSDPIFISRAFELSRLYLQGLKTNESKETIAYLIAHDIVGHGLISILLEDAANIEEIEINTPTSNIVIYHSKYGRCTTNLQFNSEADFRYVINRLISATEKEINSNFPIVDAQLTDGSRVHAQLSPYSIKGAAASIRLNSGKGMDIRRLLATKALSPEALAYVWIAIETNKNMIIAGAPAAGKTSLLLALNTFVPQNQRVITIEEDVNELKAFPNFINVVSLQGSSRKGEIDLKTQVVNALHMRPERLIIGEIRGEEAKEVFSGSNLGIPFMTTMHASANGSPIIGRLSTKPMSVEPDALNMLDLSLFMAQNAKGERYLESIVEYKWHSRAEIALEDLDRTENSDFRANVLMKNGIFDEPALKSSKVIKAHSEKNLITLPSSLKEFKKRARFLSAINLSKNTGMSPFDFIFSYKGG